MNLYSSQISKLIEELSKLPGIGAKSAISILSNIDPSSFALAIINEDTRKLTKLPGIGAKTASQIVLDLKENPDYIQSN